MTLEYPSSHPTLWGNPGTSYSSLQLSTTIEVAEVTLKGAGAGSDPELDRYDYNQRHF